MTGPRQCRASQTSSNPAPTEHSPRTRSLPEGVTVNCAMARRMPRGNSAHTRPSKTKANPRADKKSVLSNRMWVVFTHRVNFVKNKSAAFPAVPLKLPVYSSRTTHPIAEAAHVDDMRGDDMDHCAQARFPHVPQGLCHQHCKEKFHDQL